MRIRGASSRTARITRIFKRTHGPGAGRGSGFTLLELVIVVMVLGIVSAIAVPFFATALERIAADESATQVAVALRFARDQAILSGRPFRVVFNAEAGLVSVEETRQSDLEAIRDASSTMSASAVELASAFVAASHPVNKRDFVVDLSTGTGRNTVIASAAFGGAPQVTFTARGVPSAAGAASIRAGAATRTIRVTAAGDIMEE